MRVLSEAKIRAQVPIRAAIDNQRRAFRALEEGSVKVPERIIASNKFGPVLYKPFVSDDVFGLKVVSVRPSGTPGIVMLFEPDTAMPSALMNATYLTGLRTAAGSAVAFDMLGPQADGMQMTVFGAGLQAELHIRCFCAVRSFRRVAIVNRTHAKAEQLADALRSDPQLQGVLFEAVPPERVAENLQQSSTVVTATPSREALFDSAHLRSGTFVAAVGSFTPEMRELDAGLMSRSRIVADNPEEVLRTSGDFVDGNAIQCSLGSLVVSGDVEQFAGADLILWKSIGTSIQDMFIASLALERVVDAEEIEL